MGVGHLNMSDIIDVRVALPPLEEQRKVISFIDHEVGKIDELIAESEHAIDLHEERRNALISAAVTGKIDVRSLAQSVTA
jgi:type I restriction enzyme S subunit